jgi:hypothetical protein
MGMKRRDREFRLPKVTYIDFKQIDMDRVLTLLFPRLKYDGYASRRPPRKAELTVEEFATEFFEHPEWFAGFDAHRDIVRKWIETDLMDVVNRGRSNQAIAAPRPLHGNTYKFRNARHARDYGAAEQIYWMLYHAGGRRGQAARDALKRFFFPGVDLNTDRYDNGVQVDVETQALLRLDQQVTSDTRDTREPERFAPLCIGSANVMADDVLRLLAYEQQIPRSVMIDYLKILLAFHLALYHLRLLKLLPALVRERGRGLSCAGRSVDPSDGPYGDCPCRLAMLVDMGRSADSHMAELARRSADAHYRRIPAFVQAHFVVKKLDEFASYLSTRLGRLPVPAAGYFSVVELLQLLEVGHDAEREPYFRSRLASIVEDSGTADEDLDPEVRRVLEMGLGDFEAYIEVLIAVRGSFHRRYITQCLDSLLLKDSEAGLLRQPRATGSRRRFGMGSRLLEVLLQVAVLRPDGPGFSTQPIPVDDLMRFLGDRYGLFIDRLPNGDGFDQPSIVDRAALRENFETFKVRLREIGFLQDLSDAYIVQTVTPRYTIAAPVAAASDAGS